MTYPKETRPPNRLSPLSLIYPCHVALGSTLRFQMTLFTYPSAINCGWQKLLTFRPFHLAIERSLIIDIHEWWVPLYGLVVPLCILTSPHICWVNFHACAMSWIFYGRANDPWLIHIAFLVRNFLRCSEYSLLLVKLPYESLSPVVPQSYVVWSPACFLDDIMKFPLPITRPPSNGWPKTAHLILDHL